MSIEWSGIEETLGQLDEITARAIDGGKGALGLAAEHVAGVSAQLVPVETGALAGSRKVSVDGDQASIEYGTPYARYQHERMDLHHEHGQAKYLESAVRSEADEAVRIVGHGAIGSM